VLPGLALAIPSYKGAVPFVQGRFNMGGTGVLPLCGDGRKMQLIVSRVPDDLVSLALGPQVGFELREHPEHEGRSRRKGFGSDGESRGRRCLRAHRSLRYLSTTQECPFSQRAEES
jgi:hypothetical protein